METSTKTLSELIERDGITAYVVELGRVKKDEWNGQDVNAYTVTLELPANGDGRLVTPFFQGLGITEAPTVHSVLGSLVMDAQGLNIDGEEVYPFEDWASDYGYDIDSRKAENIYMTVLASARELQAFLGDKFDEYMAADTDD